MRLISLFVLMIMCCNVDAGEPHFDVEKQSIFMVKNLFDNIITPQHSRGNDEYYFGRHGGVLGQSLHSSLTKYRCQKQKRNNKNIDESPLLFLLTSKLHDTLKDKHRFSFAFSTKIYTVDRENIPRLGVNAEYILFVRAIPLTEDKYFNDIGNGINFIFAINSSADNQNRIYIDLINSYINGIPFYKFLGFNGYYASGLKIPDSEVEKMFDVL